MENHKSLFLVSIYFKLYLFFIFFYLNYFFFYAMDKINNDEDTVIRLLIKAPDQQIHDQIINCQLYWNVGQLKEHLHEVYPSKPVSL